MQLHFKSAECRYSFGRLLKIRLEASAEPKASTKVSAQPECNDISNRKTYDLGRVIGPTMPTAELLDVATKLTEARAELRGSEAQQSKLAESAGNATANGGASRSPDMVQRQDELGTNMSTKSYIVDLMFFVKASKLGQKTHLHVVIR
ncbi:hypothetical protein Tco_0571576 [Tanacetum coccineum]